MSDPHSNIPQEFSQFYLKDVTFVNLMMRRIYNVLIVANPYDAFMLEDDGRVEEKIYNEYMELGLRYPPTFTQVSTTEEAYRILRTMNIDLVICMPGNADNDAFSVARDIKQAFLIYTAWCSRLSRTASRDAYKTKTSASSTMCSAGWAIPTSFFLSSSLLKTR